MGIGSANGCMKFDDEVADPGKRKSWSERGPQLEVNSCACSWFNTQVTC